MIYVEAPSEVPRINCPKVFLAGGISGCSNWQLDLMFDMLKNEDIIVFNPRRESKPKLAREQITWEFECLRKATIISFWFATETEQPITLFELGSWSMHYAIKGDPEIVVGVHPDYSRKQDVEIQMKLLFPDLKIVDSLELLAQQIIRIARNQLKILLLKHFACNDCGVRFIEAQMGENGECPKCGSEETYDIELKIRNPF